MDPGVIKKLDESVVNRIAAGEVIQRPANALKEMIENSLDAKSSYIQITVKSGGLKQLQIQDNGTGIRKEDLEIVCERFTTSKLEKFEDLSNIATFGFRGEALASISHVAHLTIQTKTALEKCGFKASYEDGKPKGPPKPCAGNQGTIITVGDLFYNVPQRRQALRSPNEEFQKISDIVSKYAVHNASVGFMLKKAGENISLRTPPKSTKTDNIRIIYGAQIAKELLEIGFSDEVHNFKVNGWVTNVNYSARKGIFLLFINHRLVDSAALKSAVESAYSPYLPRGSYPFIYINLELEPSNVDVNVHPTKHEVHFLYEDEIVEKIKIHLETKLTGSNSARVFYKQTMLPGASEVAEKAKDDVERVYAKDLVRTDAKEQKLEKFLLSSPTKKKIRCEPNGSPSSSNSSVLKEEEGSPVRKKKETKLTSVLNMRRKVENACSSMLRRTFKQSVFVGVVDEEFALLQYETKLYLCNTRNLSRQLFYQRLIYDFENFRELRFFPGLPLRDLVMIALDDPKNGWTEEDGSKDELASKASEILIEKSPIMREYFGLTISEDGLLQTLPVLLDNHRPAMCLLPAYILRLATEVEWETEEECFQTFCEETANFYSEVPYSENGSKKNRWLMEHVVYPGLKQYLIPSNELKSSLLEVTNCSSLYKVFER